MKKILDWQKRAVVDICDEISLWSGPFGRLLLENIPMEKGMTVLDIGFGTGFPLIELSQRFGETSTIYGIDIWEEAINRAKSKIGVFEISTIKILEESASKINLKDQSIDLITSNLGINNFEEQEKVYSEVSRILKPGARLCITTNPIGTFEELFQIFYSILKNSNNSEALNKLQNYVDHRKTKEILIKEFEKFDLKLVKSIEDETNMRFVDSKAIFNHGLIRVGFRASWESLMDAKIIPDFYNQVIQSIDKIIEEKGVFSMKIPLLYLEFEKNNS